MKLKLNVISQTQTGTSSGNFPSHENDNSSVETEIISSTKPRPTLNIVQSRNIKAQNPEEIPVTFDETKILKSYMMYNGESKNAEDLVVGDELMGADSKPCKILGIDKVKERSYLVTPVKGEDFIVGKSEILSLTFCGNNRVVWDIGSNSHRVVYFDLSSKRQENKYFTVDAWGTKEKSLEAANNYLTEIGDNNYFELFVPEFLKSSRNEDFKIYKNGLDFPHTEFDIDPYIIGMWLGDGSQATSHITSADPEIVDYFRDYFADFGLLVKTDGIRHRVTTGTKKGYPGRNPLTNYLKRIGIWDNKFIPTELLLTSRENRLRLLAGLLDSDGSLSNNCYDFIQKREKLFDNVIFLARSLGFSCYKNPCVKICTNAPNGPKAGNYFRCAISGEGLEEIPTLLNRKKAHERKQIKRAYVNGIVLKYAGERDIYRLSTDTARFLMSDFTVRHRYETSENNDNKKVVIVKKEKLANFPYGYKRENGGIGINAEESKIVTFIFKEKSSGTTLKKIAEILNKDNKKTRQDSNFTDCTVSTILSYKGKYLGSQRGDSGETWPKILSEEYRDQPLLGKVHAPKFGYMKKDGNIIINENEADVIRFIFNQQKLQTTHAKIAEKLNSSPMKLTKKTPWTASTINNILRKRDKYLGTSDFPAILK